MLNWQWCTRWQDLGAVAARWREDKKVACFMESGLSAVDARTKRFHEKRDMLRIYCEGMEALEGIKY